jgi:hypothetical protein
MPSSHWTRRSSLSTRTRSSAVFSLVACAATTSLGPRRIQLAAVLRGTPSCSARSRMRDGWPARAFGTGARRAFAG